MKRQHEVGLSGSLTAEASVYDRIAARYDEAYGGPHALAEDEFLWRWLRREGLVPNWLDRPLVVDVGSGTGNLLRMSEAGGHAILPSDYLGVEPSAEMRREARRRWPIHRVQEGYVPALMPSYENVRQMAGKRPVSVVALWSLDHAPCGPLKAMEHLLTHLRPETMGVVLCAPGHAPVARVMENERGAPLLPRLPWATVQGWARHFAATSGYLVALRAFSFPSFARRSPRFPALSRYLAVESALGTALHPDRAQSFRLTFRRRYISLGYSHAPSRSF